MKRSIPVQLFMALSIVCITVLLGGILAWQNYRSVKNIMLTATGETVQHLSQALEERRRWLLDPPRSLLQVMTFNSVVRATTLPERLERLPQFAESLKASEVLSAIYVGYPNGEFILVRKLFIPQAKAYFSAPSDSEFMVQSVTLEADNTFKGEWHFYDYKLNLLQTRPKPDYQFDPRTRPWFQQAAEQTEAVISSPYVFYTTGQAGLTMSQRGASSQSVIGMDISIDALNNQLRSMMVTENTEVALIDSDGAVIAAPNRPALKPLHDAEELKLPHVTTLNSVSLSHVFQSLPTGSSPTMYQINGRPWYGMQAPMLSFNGKDARIVVAVPANELLHDAYQKIIHELVWIAIITLMLLIIGWILGQRISRPLRVLAEQVRARSEFDFSTPLGAPSAITEIRELNQVLGNMSRTIDNFQAITLALNHGTQLDQMLDAVVVKLVDAFQVESAAVYLAQDDTELWTLTTRTAGHTYPAALRVNAHDDDEVIARLTQALGESSKYLYIPLKNHKHALLGVLVLRLQPEQRYTGKAERAFKRFVHQVSSAAAVAIETRQLIEAHRQLLDAIIKLLADAIDAKSPYTGSHCKRVPILAESLIHQVIDTDQAPFAEFSMDKTELYEFRLAAWLHDCGKISTPESVMDKATKLEIQYNRIHEIRTRFEVLWRDAEIAYWQGVAKGGDAHTLRHTLQRRQSQLHDEFAFIANANLGAESMESADIDRLQQIGSQRWWRHFDYRLGLAPHELARLDPTEQALPVQEYLLADRTDHIVPWTRTPPVDKDDPDNVWGFDMRIPDHAKNYGELYNLSIRRGTLTPEERFKINEHVVQTIMMLNSLPLPSELKRIPDIAGTHHEKMDGTGYPRGLNHTKLGIPDRVMMIADIFEALTAVDRPYKTPHTLSAALDIMKDMACTGHIDPDLFKLFLTSGVYNDYGRQFLLPSQLDEVDVQALLDQVTACTS